MGNAVERSNNPNLEVGDVKGGFHEEGGRIGFNAAGVEVAVDAKPGQANNGMAPGSIVSVDPAVPLNQDDMPVPFYPKLEYHVHPRGKNSSGQSFIQPPSRPDYTRSKMLPDYAAINDNYVLGAGNNTVYMYRNGAIVYTFPLDKFIKIGQ